MPAPDKTPKEHRAYVAKELRAFADLVEAAPEPRPLLRPIIRARAALQVLLEAVEAEAGLPAGFWCCHCGERYNEDYMVQNSVWKEAVPDVPERYQAMIAQGLPKKGIYLHLRCMEQRLGRRLTPDDLSPAPINDAIRYFLQGRA